MRTLKTNLVTDKIDIRERFNWSASKDRRGLASDKLELFEGRHQKTLAALVRSRLSDPISADQVIKWTNTSRNLLRQITRTCCIAYSRGVVRHLAASIGEAAASAFAAVLVESKMGALAPLINQYAFLLGPTMVLPQVESDGTFWLDLVPPSRAECRRTNPTKVSELLYQRDDGMFIAVDGQAFTYFNSDGEPLSGTPPVVHGLGYAPVAIFRSEHWTSGGWWNEHSHRALVDAALDVAVFEALLNFTRKNSGKQMVIIGPKGTLGGKQIVGNPDRPLFFEGDANMVSVKSVDLESTATTWLELISAKTAGVCELYGLPPSVLSGTNGNHDWGQVGLARAPEVLDSLRNEQVPWMHDGEMQLFPAVCDLLRASTHKHALALPPGDEVRDALRLRFIEPIANIDHKTKRLDLFERQEKLGLATVAELEIEDRPELTIEEAQANVDARNVRYLARLDELAKRNAPAEQAAAIDSLAAAQGRSGGLTKAMNEAKASDEENT